MKMGTLAAGVLALALCSVTLPIVAQARSDDGKDRRVDIVNQSGQTINEMHVTNRGDSNWGVDQFGTDVLLAGNNWWWNIDDGSRYCHYDFMFVMADGSKQYAWNYDVCTGDEIDVQ